MNKNDVNTPDTDVVPIFFAVDDNYVPYLAVALRSIIDNASPDYKYMVYILIDKLSVANTDALLSMGNENFGISFMKVGEKLDRLGSKMHLRDYYTKATYYRFFIPELFPQYTKGLYLDCDIVVTGDISELYRTELGNDLTAAVVEEVMLRYPVFGDYTEEVLGVPRNEYFSAGILVMNLSEMRRMNIEYSFEKLLGERIFRVTQDQDYLNVICRGRVRLLDTEWNRTAFPDIPVCVPYKIIHFKLNWKPWHYSGVSYEKLFWQYAEETDFYDLILSSRNGYTRELKNRDAKQFEALKELAYNETLNALYEKSEHEEPLEEADLDTDLSEDFGGLYRAKGNC